MHSNSSLHSMTGYGEARAKLGRTVNAPVLVCRVRSLNHRFLDLKVRMPRSDMSVLEQEIRKRVSEIFKRGSVDVSLVLEEQAASSGVVFDEALATSYWKSAVKLAKKLKAPAPTLDAVLRLPGIASTANSESSKLSDIPPSTILNDVVAPALDALKKARAQEGRALAKHLFELLDQMAAHLKSIEALEAPMIESNRKSAAERIRQTITLLSEANDGQVSQSSDFEQRMREEAAFWIERRDFEEERVRFAMHLKTVRGLLQAKTPAPEGLGRKLEFFQQELHREINTLANKAQSPDVSKHAIEIKLVLDKLKEQLANVE